MKNRINYFLLMAVIVLAGLYLYSFKAKDNGTAPRKYIEVMANGWIIYVYDGSKTGKSEKLQKKEYKDYDELLTSEFNDLEAQGYELIATTSNGESSRYIFRSK
jgi:hypothetical protein